MSDIFVENLVLIKNFSLLPFINWLIKVNCALLGLTIALLCLKLQLQTPMPWCSYELLIEILLKCPNRTKIFIFAPVLLVNCRRIEIDCQKIELICCWVSMCGTCCQQFIFSHFLTSFVLLYWIEHNFPVSCLSLEVFGLHLKISCNFFQLFPFSQSRFSSSFKQNNFRKSLIICRSFVLVR